MSIFYRGKHTDYTGTLNVILTSTVFGVYLFILLMLWGFEVI